MMPPEDSTNKNVNGADLAVAFSMLMRGVENEVASRVVGIWERHINELPDLLSRYPYKEKTDDPRHTTPRMAGVQFSKLVDGHMAAFQKVIDFTQSHLAEQAKESYEWGSIIALELLPGDRLVEAEKMPALVFSAGDTGNLEPMSAEWLAAIINAPSPWNKMRLTERFASMSAKERKKLLIVLANAITEGESMRSVISSIKNITKQTASRSETIARSEIMRVSNTAMLMSYGNNSAVEGIQTIATLDKMTCMICASYDRAEFWYGKKKPSVSEAPTYPLHPRCRCFYVPISGLWKRLGVDPPFKTRASSGGPVDYSLDYPSWLRRMENRSTGFALEMLGEYRYNMWMKGASLKSMIEPIKIGQQITGRIKTLEELKRQLSRFK